MCSVAELVHTLRALDAGKETKAIRECMQDVYYTQQLLRQYVAHYPVCRRTNRGGMWVTMSTLGSAETPVYMPVGVPFSVWESSEGRPHVEMNEYTLVYMSEFEVPGWVHESSDLGDIFERWFAGAPAETSATLGKGTFALHTLRIGLKFGGESLEPRHFLCVVLRRLKCVKTRVNGKVQCVSVKAKAEHVWFSPKQNRKFNFFQDGSQTFPFIMSSWLKVDRKGGPWEPYPLMLPPGHAALSEPNICDAVDV
jgi:hypothetical protein